MKRAALMLVLLIGCGGSQPQVFSLQSASPQVAPAPAPLPSHATPASPEERIVSDANQFGFDLFGRLRSNRGNIVVSPASIGVALTMTYAGARGETAAQMASTLHLPESQDAAHAFYGSAVRTWNSTSTATLRVANRIYVEQSEPVEEAFLALTRDAYGAEAQRVDFSGNSAAVRLEINGWVEQQTEGRIRDLLPPNALRGGTSLVLTNAVYFKAGWQRPFDPRRTQQHPFTLPSGAKVSVSMMQAKARFPYAEHSDGLRILEMPYAGDELRMVWLLPEAANGLAALEERLSSEALGRWRRAARAVEVEVGIPRFRLEPPTTELGIELKAMGMVLAFEPAADFSGITGTPGGLWIDEVYHKAFIEVNEEGAEAAAATAVIMRKSASMRPAQPPRFYADRPFLFLLMDQRTGAVLFLGRVANPR